MVNTASKISFSRRILFLGIVVVTTITTSIIFFANVEAREYYSHWIISISASATASLAFLIIFQQKQYHGLIEKADLALVMALGLSLCAETLWAIYEIYWTSCHRFRRWQMHYLYLLMLHWDIMFFQHILDITSNFILAI